MPKVLILGANSAIAGALNQTLSATHEILTVSRTPTGSNNHWVCDYSEPSFKALGKSLETHQNEITQVWLCTGVLHDELVFPERKLQELSTETLSHYFQVNSIIPALVLRYVVASLPRDTRAKVAFLSAQIGSIEDNALGGWYGYRASKAALNMLIKTASIELKRTHPELLLCALHPGTTRSALSAPFEKRIAADKLYSPEQTAQRLVEVVNTLSTTGQFLHWSGTPLPW